MGTGHGETKRAAAEGLWHAAARAALTVCFLGFLPVMLLQRWQAGAPPEWSGSARSSAPRKTTKVRRAWCVSPCASALFVPVFVGAHDGCVSFTPSPDGCPRIPRI